MASGNIHLSKTSVLSSKIKVIVIDHKIDFLQSVGDFLQCYSFDVTCVDRAGTALKMLMEEKNKFDFLLIASDIEDVDIITFLQLTKDLDILSMVMCPKIDNNFLLEVLENGGFRILTIPITKDVLVQTFQDVIRARLERYKTITESETIGMRSESYIDRRQEGTMRTKRVKQQGLESGSSNMRVCVEWTDELHHKFIKAILKLGETQCYPRKILNAMGEPGLTRIHVASHLQKCRTEVGKILQPRAGRPSLRRHKLPLSSYQGVDLIKLAKILGVKIDHDQVITDMGGTYASSNGRNGNPSLACIDPNPIGPDRLQLQNIPYFPQLQ